MSFLSFKKKNKKSRVALVFDIRSATVGGALVALDKEKPRVLYNVRKEIPAQAELEFNRFVNSMFETFKVVVERIEKKGIPHLNQKNFEEGSIDEVLFVYASPWYTAHTKVLTIEEGKPFTVTQSLINKLIRKEEESFFETKGSNVVERAVTSILLNGYSVENIEGKTVDTLSLTFSSTIVPKQIAHGLESLLARSVHVDRTSHHSFPLVTFAMMRNTFPDMNNFLLLDVSGEVSDLSLVRNDVLLETTSFPKGTHFILRKLINELKTSANEAKSMIRMYTQDALHTNATEQLKRVLKDAQRTWAEDCMSALQDMRQNMQAPGRLFFITEPHFAPLIENAIHEADVENTLEVKPISYAMLRDCVSFSDIRTYDPLISLDAFFLHGKG